MILCRKYPVTHADVNISKYNIFASVREDVVTDNMAYRNDIKNQQQNNTHVNLFNINIFMLSFITSPIIS